MLSSSTPALAILITSALVSAGFAGAEPEPTGLAELPLDAAPGFGVVADFVAPVPGFVLRAVAGFFAGAAAGGGSVKVAAGAGGASVATLACTSSWR